MWKDIIFSVLLTLIVLNICMLLTAPESGQKRILIHNAVLFLPLCFFRHNGFLVFIPTVIVIAVVFKKHRKLYLTACICSIAVYLLFQAVGIPLLGIKRWRNSEGFSIPLQQIARTVAYDPDSISEEQYQVIKDYFSGRDIGELYSPNLSNPVKYNFDEEAFARDPKPVLKLWADLGKTHPKEYIEAILCNNYGYWYPGAVKFLNICLSLSINNYVGIHSQPLINSGVLTRILNYLGKDQYYEMPVLSCLFTPGIYCWTLFFAWRYCRYRKNRFWIALIPLLSLWIQMIGTPAFCEFRYTYGIVTSLPLFLSVSLLPEPSAETD